MLLEAISLYLHTQKGESFTLSEISKSTDISKDRLRHQARRALAAGHIELAGETNRSSSTPAQLYRAAQNLKTEEAVEKADSPPKICAKSMEELERDRAYEAYLKSSVNRAAMKSMCLTLSGVSQVPASVKKMVEERKSRRTSFDFA